MNNLIKLIGGACIRISSEDIALKRIDIPAEQLFYIDNCEKPDIAMKIFSGNSDCLNDAEILSETSGLWNSYIKGDKFLIDVKPADNHSPSMTVVTNKDAAEADAYVKSGFFHLIQMYER